MGIGELYEFEKMGQIDPESPAVSRHLLGHRDFTALVRGGVVRKGTTEIALQDIGHSLMAYEIAAAAKGRPSDGLPLSYAEGMRRLGVGIAAISVDTVTTKSDLLNVLFGFNVRCGGWELPGGKNERDEYAHETASREFEEETGLVVHRQPVFLFYQEVEPGWLELVFGAAYIGSPQVREPDKVSQWKVATLSDPPQPLTHRGQVTVDNLRACWG